MLTMCSMVYKCDLPKVALIASWAGLRQELGQKKYDPYHFWQDLQTSGGGCRLVWKSGFVWVSRHSGYAWADITEEVCLFLEEQGAKKVSQVPAPNPHIYGMRSWDLLEEQRIMERRRARGLDW